MPHKTSPLATAFYAVFFYSKFQNMSGMRPTYSLCHGQNAEKKIVSAVLGWLWCRLAQSHHQMKGTRRKKTAASKQKPYQTGYGRKQWDANTQRFKRTRCDAVCEIEQSIEIDKGANVRTNFVMLSAGDFIQIRRLLSERRAGPLLPRDVVS